MSFRIWVRTVERQHRIRLPEDAVAAISWLDPKQATSGVGFMGAFGQLQIAPAPLEQTFSQRLSDALNSSPAEPTEASTRWADFARFSATRWSIKFLAESGRKRMTLVLPKETRALELVPARGAAAVIFVTGNIVEIWKGPDWVAHMRRMREELDDLAEDAADNLKERDPNRTHDSDD